MKKTIIVSAVNLVEAGPLTVLQECLKFLSAHGSGAFDIIALVNNKNLAFYQNIEYVEFPKSKKSWAYRLYYEYFYFGKLAKQLKPFLWLSLHDMTPSVSAPRRAVYCHNASPFYRLSLKDMWLDPKFALFNFFYRYLYAINIKKNDFIIVQQDWLRNKFKQTSKALQIIVAPPNLGGQVQINPVGVNENTFFYPSLPRVFKNFETIGKAAEILIKQGVEDFQAIFTISGAENRYSRYIFNSFKHVKNIKFIGVQNRDKVFELYGTCGCVVFPSKLETWGIPITEAKLFGKPLLLADLEYAHETLGAYDRSVFFDPDDPAELAELMKKVIDKTIVFEKTEGKAIPAPLARNWKELFDILLK